MCPGLSPEDTLSSFKVVISRFDKLSSPHFPPGRSIFKDVWLVAFGSDLHTPESLSHQPDPFSFSIWCKLKSHQGFFFFSFCITNNKNHAYFNFISGIKVNT
jgi:hypothetical protein